MPTSDELRAALALAELEDELTAAKGDGPVGRELKDRVRAARQEYREQHRTPSAGVGDVTAEPDAVAAAATVREA